LRTQQIIGFESGVTETVDPLAGSFFVEALTDEVETKAWELINKITAMGGSVTAIENGFIQDEIAKSAYAYQRNIESGQKIIVGVNKFTIEHETPVPSFKIDESIRQIQTQRINELKARRNSPEVNACLENIRKAAVEGTNLMPPVIAAVEALCTLGEIADVLRKIYGEY
jgi:methylmalonyl-CoA mutase N-terminal domain/subunit